MTKGEQYKQKKMSFVFFSHVRKSVSYTERVDLDQGSPTFLGPQATFWILIKVGALILILKFATSRT